jgi:hypothetical protein
VIHYGGGTSRERCGNDWVAVMQRQAILQFCRITRGRIYAEAYRAVTVLNALVRLVVLAMMYPFRKLAAEKQLVHSTSDKWVGVLKWGLGLDHRVSSLSESA